MLVVDVPPHSLFNFRTFFRSDFSSPTPASFHAFSIAACPAVKGCWSSCLLLVKVTSFYRGK